MARNGFKIFDSDTHVGPYMEVLRCISPTPKRRLPAWDKYKRPTARPPDL